MSIELNPEAAPTFYSLLASNREMRATLEWVARHSLDYQARRRAAETLGRATGSTEKFPVDWASSELDGEWCV